MNIVYSYFVQHKLNYSPSVYGWLIASIAVAFVIGLQISKQKNKSASPIIAKRIILHALLVEIFALLSLLLVSIWHLETLLTTIIPLLVFFMATGIIFSLSMQLALQSTAQYPGAKAGLFGFAQAFSGTFLGAIAALFSPMSLLPLSLILLIAVVLITVQYSFFLHKQKNNS